MIWREDSRDILRTTFTYDALHRLDFTDYPGNTPDIDYIYFLDPQAPNRDRIVNVERKTSGGTLVTRQSYHHELGGDRIEAYTLDVGSQNFTTHFQYNDVDCLEQITYPTTTIPIDYTCDDANRVIAVQTGGHPLIDQVTYHPSGQLSGMTYHDVGGPVPTTRTYDTRQRIESIAAPNFIDHFYTWDGVGNLETLTDNGQLFSFAYDDLDRLTEAPGPWGATKLYLRTLWATGLP